MRDVTRILKLHGALHLQLIPVLILVVVVLRELHLLVQLQNVVGVVWFGIGLVTVLVEIRVMVSLVVVAVPVVVATWQRVYMLIQHVPSTKTVGSVLEVGDGPVIRMTIVRKQQYICIWITVKILVIL
jgi:hypothetical protein